MSYSEHPMDLNRILFELGIDENYYTDKQKREILHIFNQHEQPIESTVYVPLNLVLKMNKLREENLTFVIDILFTNREDKSLADNFLIPEKTLNNALKTFDDLITSFEKMATSTGVIDFKSKNYHVKYYESQVKIVSVYDNFFIQDIDCKTAIVKHA